MKLLILLGLCSLLTACQPSNSPKSQTTKGGIETSNQMVVSASGGMSLDISFPESNQVFSKSFWTTLTASATGASKVTFSVNGIKVCDALNGPYYNCSYQTPSTDSQIVITATATSWSGETVSTSRLVTVGSSAGVLFPLSVNLISPEVNASLTKNFWTTFTSTATGAVKVTYYVNGSKLCDAVSGPYYNCSYLTPNSDVAITVKAVAVAVNGSTSEMSRVVVIGSGSDPAPSPSPAPAGIPLSIIAPADGSSLAKNFWTTLTSSGAGAVKVVYYVNETKLCETSSGPWFNCSYLTPSTDVYIVIKAIAFAANGATVEKLSKVKVGNPQSPSPVPAPVGGLSVAIAFPAEGGILQKNFWTTLTSSASEAQKVIFYANGVKVCETTAGPWYNCSYLTPAVDSQVVIKAMAFNAAGASVEKSVNVKIGAGDVTPSPVPTPTPTPSPAPSPGPSEPIAPSGYYLAFQDEFNDEFSGAPNPSKWDYSVNFAINNEAQCYTNNRRANVRVENRTSEGASNGYLVLQLKKEPWVCPQDGNKQYQYTSGSITTRKQGYGPFMVNASHGRYEIRAKIPAGRGTWPALWLTGHGPLGNWPNSGEIDIMEAVGFEEAEGKYILHSTIHRNSKFGWPNQWGSTGQGMNYYMSEPPSAKFHTWVLEWTPTSLEFFVDGNRVTKLLIVGDALQDRLGFFRSDFAGGSDPLAWPYSLEVPGTQFELILNLAWGGEWGGYKGLDDSIFAKGNIEMLVDYVRIYKKK